MGNSSENLPPEQSTLTKASDNDPVISAELLGKLSPHRMHESTWLKELLCRVGLHRWYYVSLENSIPGKELGLCRWCPKAKLRGVGGTS
jgi:hypothetical protein